MPRVGPLQRHLHRRPHVPANGYLEFTHHGDQLLSHVRPEPRQLQPKLHRHRLRHLPPLQWFGRNLRGRSLPRDTFGTYVTGDVASASPLVNRRRYHTARMPNAPLHERPHPYPAALAPTLSLASTPAGATIGNVVISGAAGAEDPPPRMSPPGPMRSARLPRATTWLAAAPPRVGPASAVSTATLTSANGYLEFTAPEGQLLSHVRPEPRQLQPEL